MHDAYQTVGFTRQPKSLQGDGCVYVRTTAAADHISKKINISVPPSSRVQPNQHHASVVPHLFDAHLVVHLAVDGVHAAVEGAGLVAAEEPLVGAQLALECP